MKSWYPISTLIRLGFGTSNVIQSSPSVHEELTPLLHFNSALSEVNLHFYSTFSELISLELDRCPCSALKPPEREFQIHFQSLTQWSKWTWCIRSHQLTKHQSTADHIIQTSPISKDVSQTIKHFNSNQAFQLRKHLRGIFQALKRP